ncbi:hypothetical protein PENTCL1PPCAC_27793, partial [Pristionchus entomophagus]
FISPSFYHFIVSMRWISLLFLLPSISFCSIVQTAFGEVEGFEHQTEKGIPAHVFLGIRYGKSTNGSSRFQKPEMVERWEPSRLIANDFGASCDSFTPGRVPSTIYSEDCLFLNIITPKLGGEKLPVFFYIHGGFYEVGSSTYLGYKRLAERFAAEGIVVVTINYRLGPFGLFSLGDSTAPGNLGLWDQTLALRFLHEVLPSFGGDPSRMTVGGHSAGSASASALQFSPHSNNLFSQAILISGSSLAEFAQSELVVDESKKLLLEFDCPLDSTEVALSCLQRFTPDEIIRAVEKIGSSRRHPYVVKYNPRIDGDFFPLPIHELVKSSPKKRTLQGATDQESALFVMHEEMSWIAGISLTKAEQESFSRRDLIDFIETVVITDEEYQESASSLRDILIDFYAGKEQDAKDSKFYLRAYSDLNSDLQFLIPMYHEIQLKLTNNWPSYLYILQHNIKSFPRQDFAVQGMYHGDEMEHFTDSIVLFSLKESEKEDHEFGAHFVSSMVNFIKNGDPSSSSFSWPMVTKEHSFQHASITANISLMKDAYRSEATSLWLESVPKSLSGRKITNPRLPGVGAHIV